MGGNNNYYYYNNNNNNNNNIRQKKSSSSSFSMFGLFKFKKNINRSSRVDDASYGPAESEAPSARRIWPSDEDRGRYWPVAEPGIDRRAEDFIAKIHKNIATDTERKTYIIPSNTATATAVAKA